MIYRPAEDSHLLQQTIKDNIKDTNIKVLEIGSGSGIQLQTLKNLGVFGQNIIGSDINPEAVKCCKELGFNCIESDLFQNFHGKFDLIVFNPPYLPKNKDEDLDSQIATTGGKQGSEIINKFLEQAKEHLTPNSKIFLLTSSLTENINWGGWKKKLLSERKLFMEKLFVWKLTL